MHINIQLFCSWLLYITATVILVLLWLNKFEVERDTIDKSIHDATVLIRVANFILTSEILLLVSTLYGGFTWFMIQKKSMETKHANRWIFYDGGNTLLPTLKAFLFTDLISFKFASAVALGVMIATYFLDIFYVNSISYFPVNQCEVRDTNIDLMSAEQMSLANFDRFTIVYGVGSRIGLLSYNNIEYTSNVYRIPAVGNTTYLQNYTTVEYNIMVQCKDTAMRIENATMNSSDQPLSIYAEGYNQTFTEMEDIGPNSSSTISVIGENAFGIGLNGNDSLPFTFFISFTEPIGSNNKNFIDLTPMTFGNNTVRTAYCGSNVTYQLVNDISNWSKNFDNENVETYSSRAMQIPLLAYRAYSTTDGFLQWLINGKSVNNNNNQTISLSDIEKRITVSMIEFLKGGGINGTTTTLGNYCFPSLFKTSIDPWYKIMFSVVQVLVTIFLVVYSFFSFGKDLVNNDTDTLLKYSKNDDAL